MIKAEAFSRAERQREVHYGSQDRLIARAVLHVACRHLCAAAARRLRVWAAFFAEAERSANERPAEASPPLWPPFFAGAVLVFLPRPDPLFLPPPVILFTVAQARRAASSSGTPRFSYPSLMCLAWRFCLLE